MPDLERSIASLTMAPYIVKAMALMGVGHQLSTMAILLDYKFTDPGLLEASVIHDLFENAPGMPGVTEAEISAIDADGPAVYRLVMEVTIRMDGRIREPKDEYLRRVLIEGSDRAKILKLADRISNLTALGFVHDPAFVRRYLDETKRYVLPYAETVNRDMFRELGDLVASRERLLSQLK